MFETNDMSRMNNPLTLLGDDNYLWSNVSLRLHVPWFYVVYSIDYEDDSKNLDILFVSNIKELINMSNEIIVHIDQVYLVSPGHLNKSDKWMMEPIDKIMEGSEPEYNQISHIYIVENGNRYIDSGFGSKEEKLINIKTLYANEHG